MSHEVEIEASRLDAVFDRYAALPEMEPGQDLMPYQEPPESEWLPSLLFAFSWLAAMAPEWGVPEHKVQELAEKGAAVMDQFFPHGPGSPERLPPWAQFLVCLGGIVMVYGWDWQTMTIKPLTPPEDEPEGETATTEGRPAPAQKPGKFSTLGSNTDDE